MSEQNNKKRSRLLLLKLPGLGSFIEISSDYASEGSSNFFEKIAPARYWLSTLGWPILVSMLLAVIPYPCSCMPYAVKIEAEPHDIALSLIPSLLGFGIGAYALVFGLGGDLLKKIQEGHNKKELATKLPSGSVLSINSAFAFPLAMMAITTIVASVQKILPEYLFLSTATWFLTFLCLTLTYQLIVALYRLGRVIILDKI
jgi:hypothetical protein